MLDDAEYGFDRMLAHCIQRSPCLCLQAVCHLLNGILACRGRRIRREALEGGGGGRRASSPERFNAVIMAGMDISGAETACITKQASRLTQRFRIVSPGRQQRHNLLLVVGRRSDVDMSHQQAVGIEGGLGVVTLIKALTGDRHDT